MCQFGVVFSLSLVDVLSPLTGWSKNSGQAILHLVRDGKWYSKPAPVYLSQMDVVDYNPNQACYYHYPMIASFVLACILVLAKISNVFAWL